MTSKVRARAVRIRRRSRRPFSAALEPLEGRALLATVYVDASNLSANPDGTQANPYRQVQAAINSTALDDAAADTIKIAPGVYRETINVTRSVRLEGPNANIGPGGTRGPEAIILPSANNPNAGRNIIVKTSNVQIAGLKIDGHSDALTGGAVFNGIALNSSSGISNVDVAGVNYHIPGLVVEDNVIQNFTHFGVLVDGGDPSDPATVATGNFIRDNTIDNIPFIATSPIQSDQGRGVSIEHNFLAEVSGNVITRAATGIQVIYSLVKPPAGAMSIVRDNVIRHYDRGIYVYTQDSGAPAFAVTGNKVTAEASGATASNIGIDVVRVLDTTTGTIANNDVAGASIGVRLDYSWTTAGLTVSGGTLSGNGYGVVLTNVDPIATETTKKAVKANLIGVTIQGSTIAGLKVENALAPAALGVTLTVDAATTLTGNARGAVIAGGASAKLIESPATAPVVTLIGVPGSPTSSPTASFAYTTSDNISSPGDMIVQYSLDGGAFVAAAQPVTLSGLAPGAHTFVLRATDQAGNVGSTSYAWTVGDATPVQPAPSTPALLAASDTGASAGDGVTADNTPTFVGTAPTGSTVTLFAGSTTLGTTVADSAGNWTFTVGGAGTPVASLADGAFAVTATDTGPAGTSSPSSARSIVIDTVSPGLTLTSTPAAQTVDTSASFAFTAVDPLPSSGGLVLQYSLDGAAFLPAGSPISLTNLAVGSHSLVLRATDRAGNVGTTTYSWLINPAPPPAQPAAPSTPALSVGSDTGASSIDGITSVRTPTFTGSAPAASTVSLYAGSTLLGSTTATSGGLWTFTVGGTGSSALKSLTDGTYAITATSTVSGITSVPSGARTIVVDTQAPTIQASRSPLPNSAGWNNTDVVAGYTAGDALSGLASAATGSFTFTNEGKGQSRTFTVADLAGNTASASVSSVNIDKTPPGVTLSASTTSLAASGKTVTVNFNGRMTDSLSGIVKDATFTVSDSYGLISTSGKVTFGSNGKYSFSTKLSATNTSRTTSRVYTITVTGKDAAGNVKTVSVTVLVRPTA